MTKKMRSKVTLLVTCAAVFGADLEWTIRAIEGWCDCMGYSLKTRVECKRLARRIWNLEVQDIVCPICMKKGADND